MKILLDPLIYWFFDDSEKELDLQYWDKVTLIIEKYFDIKYISSRYFIRIIQRLNKEPFKMGREENILKQKIIKRMIQNLDYLNNINEVKCNNYIFPNDFIVTTNNELNQYFANMVKHLCLNNISCLLFLSRRNHGVNLKDEHSIYFIKHISGEINSSITKLLVDKTFVKQNSVCMPTLNSPLPNVELCDNFYCLQKEMIKFGNSPISVFMKITEEVAYRNQYTFDKVVTNKNSNDKHKRKIYTYNKHHYLSADFESGAFELCDKKGKHQDEYTYDNKPQHKRDKSGKHDINV